MINKSHINVSLFSCFIILLLLTGCSKESSAEKPAKPSDPDIVYVSAEAIRHSKITPLVVQEATVNSQIETTGEIKTDINKFFHINSTVSGRVVQDNLNLGDNVRQGQVVAMVQNLEVPKIYSGYIQQLHENEIQRHQIEAQLSLAKANYSREKRLYAEGISAQKDYLQAQSDYTVLKSELHCTKEKRIHIKAEAKSLLSAYGVRLGNPDSEFVPTNSPITSVRSGVVTKKNITVGDMISPEQSLYEISNLNSVWLDITVYARELTGIKEGQIVSFISDSIPEKTFSGRINYIQPVGVDENKTFLARAFINNPQGLLKPGMYGKVNIKNDIRITKPFIPERALQTYGKENFVFLVLGPNNFKKQLVKLGEKVNGGYLVYDGVKAGDRVVGKGSFLIKAELLKSQMSEEE